MLDLKPYLGLSIEVMDINNRLLTVAEIVDFGAEHIELVNRHEDLPMLIYRTSVKVAISSPAGLTVLVGHVTNSDRRRMQVTGLMTLADFEKRAYFRVPLSKTTSAYFIEKDLEPEQEIQCINAENMMPFKIVNVSLSGVLIEGRNHLRLGDRMFIEIPTQKKTLLLKCILRRKVEDPEVKDKLYGCEFQDTKTRDIDILCSELFRMQAEAVKKNKK